MERNTTPKKLTNSQQFIKLVEEMEKNPDIARGFPNVGKTKEDVNEFWKNLSIMLNALGPPTKYSLEWRRVWNDYKRNLKQKIAKNAGEIRATGGGRNAQQPLSPMEQQVDALIQLTKSGAPSGNNFPTIEGNNCRDQELGASLDIGDIETISTGLENFINDNSNHNLVDNNADSLQTHITTDPNATSNSRRNPKPSSVPQDKQRIQLLETQTTNQTEIVQILQKIETNTYKMQSYYKKTYELKAKKLKLFEEQIIRQNKNELQNQKMLFEKLKLKKRLLAIEEKKLE